MMHQKVPIDKQTLSQTDLSNPFIFLPSALCSLGFISSNTSLAISSSLNIVYKGGLHKFKQTPDLLQQLKDTENRMLVEASPLDNIWGTRMADNDEGVENPINWKGLNLLGQAINYSQTYDVKRIDTNKGKIIDGDLKVNDWEELCDSIDFCLFSTPDRNLYNSIKLEFKKL